MTLVTLARRRSGTEFLEVPARSVLNPPEATGMPFWSLNPYVGCEFGCAYCYARFAHAFRLERGVADGHLPASTAARVAALDRPWLAFEREILVKRRADFCTALARDLARVRRRARERPQTIAIGTATDPYQPSEPRWELTRLALFTLMRERGLRITVVTKSPLVARDADLLRALAARHALGVYVSLITLDGRLIRLFEPRTPLPHARIQAMRRLAAAEVPVGIFCAPVLPALTDDFAGLRELLAAAKNAGAQFAAGAALRISAGTWPPLEHALERSRPDLLAAYRRRYRRGRYASDRYREALEQRFEKLRAELGMRPGPFANSEPLGTHQLSLWGAGANGSHSTASAV